MYQIRLDDLNRRSLLRKLRIIDSATGPEVRMDGRMILLLSSNNYLGLATHPKVVEAAAQSLRRYGVGAGSSRVTAGTLRPHAELEARLAAFKHTESALVFSTGYHANLGLIQTLAEDNRVIYTDRLCHASLIDACRLSKATLRVFRHRDAAQLASLLARKQPPAPALIVTDGVFSMDGDLAPLPELVKIAEQTGSTVVVDDAHGTGVMGPEGRGTAEHFGLTGGSLVQMGTLSKALGGFGGFVVGPRTLIDYLVNRARSFLYTTALPPAIAAAAVAALDVVESEPERRETLWQLTRRLQNGAHSLGYDTLGSQSPIVPILIGDAGKALKMGARLLEHGIYAPAIRPPTVPEGTSRLRMSVTAAHTPQQIDDVLGVLEKLRAEVRAEKA